MFLAKISVALLALGLVLWFGMGTESHWLATRGWSRVLNLAWLVALGGFVYFAVLGVLGFRLKDFSRRSANY